jgi:hypothetical protein
MGGGRAWASTALSLNGCLCKTGLQPPFSLSEVEGHAQTPDHPRITCGRAAT